MKPVKAFVGLVDGTIYFSQQRTGNYHDGHARLAQVFANKEECQKCCDNVVEVIIHELPKRKKAGKP